MPMHGWMLALCLWCSALGSLTAAPSAAARTASRLTEPGGGKPGKGRRAGSVWPFWAAPPEDRTPSFLSLPFSVPFDLWSGGGAEGPSGTREAPPNGSGAADSEGPATASSREEPLAPTRTGTVTAETTSDPPAPTATDPAPGSAGSRRPHAPGLHVSVSGADAQTPPTAAVAVTATHSSHASSPAPRTEEEQEGGETHSSSPDPITAEATEPTSAGDRMTAAGPGPGSGPGSGADAGVSGSGTRAAEGRTEAEATAGDGAGDFEDVAWRPTPTEPSLSAAPPARGVLRGVFGGLRSAGLAPAPHGSRCGEGGDQYSARDHGHSADADCAADLIVRFFSKIILRSLRRDSFSRTRPARRRGNRGTLPETGGEVGTRPEVDEPIRRWTASVSPETPLGPLHADPPGDDDDEEDWSPDTTADDSSPPPDCDSDPAGLCNASEPWGPAFPDDDDIDDDVVDDDNNNNNNRSYDPSLPPAPPMLVPLSSDWGSALATWGRAWEAHVYGLGAVFAALALASALNLLCLPARCPSGCGYFALVDLFLLTACCSRAFSLFYDAYGRRDRLPPAGALLLHELPFPCLTAAFGIVFLLLSMRSRMQLSSSLFQHPCFLAALVLLHFGATLGSVVLLQVFTRLPCLAFVSQGSFVALAAFLSAAYFAFYCYVRADAKHIYHLNNTSPLAERYHRCPFADPKDWDRAAVTAAFSALFALACAGLQLYAMLHALGLGGAQVFRPWPWWAFHLGCRVCEAGVCLSLALVVGPPLFCSGDLPQPGLCWPRLSCPRGRVDLKSPVLTGNYQWSLSQQEKLVICDSIGRRESECLPLYTLVDTRLSSLDGLDLLCHAGGRLSPGALDEAGSPKSSPASDSTGDLRPPSPINLRRSIDEALFGEPLFPRSLFGASRLRGSSEFSLDARGAADLRPFAENPADRGLYRTSSCAEMERPPEERRGAAGAGGGAGSDSDSSGGCWRGSSASLDGSSLVLCASPEGRGRGSFGVAAGNPAAQLQRRYRTPEGPGAPAERDLAVQAEFISVCRQIDALSVCSDTIDL
ncbi:proline-rich transmembrane protein 4 [Conger conger]|uniref:proline-rich transmembrane protein 4 n=1 Tax=Conger conger TaxID=82655 RepID=UPI002A5A38B4|nr:proline-rich transmembrane protein 4 [Conger conger]